MLVIDILLPFVAMLIVLAAIEQSGTLRPMPVVFPLQLQILVARSHDERLAKLGKRQTSG